MKARVLSFASLASPLARSQTQAVIDRIGALMPRVTCQLTLVPSPVAAAKRDTENFVAVSPDELAHLGELVRGGRARLVVAAAADLSQPLPPGIAIVCVPDRATPFDAFLNRQGLIMDEMTAGNRVGVITVRSRRQLSAVWPELEFRILRGGVDRAMEIHLRHGEIDGLVLPAGVTEHLGIQGIVAEIFAPEFVLPSPGQGILVVLGREDDLQARDDLAELHSEATAIEFAAEQAFRSRMITDQDLPVGALARVQGDELCIAGATGAGYNRVVVTGGLNEAAAVGAGLAQQILCSGDSFADLLEAEFPEGLPDLLDDRDLAADDDEEDGGDRDGAPADEDPFFGDEFAGYADFEDAAEEDPADSDEEDDGDDDFEDDFEDDSLDEDDYD